MFFPSLEDELEEIVKDAAAVIDWAEHVRLQVRKAIDRLSERLVLAERENAALLCEELVKEYLAKDGQVTLNQTVVERLHAVGAREAADRIRSGRRAASSDVPPSTR